MSEDDAFITADKMLAAMDFASERQSLENRHADELREVLKKLISTVDALQALEQHCGDLVETGKESIPHDSVKVLVKMTLRHLADLGVEPMDAEGDELDLRIHEVESVELDTSEEDDTILREVQKGYIWRNRPLRLARVVVSTSME